MPIRLHSQYRSPFSTSLLLWMLLVALFSAWHTAEAKQRRKEQKGPTLEPTRTEIIQPIHHASFNQQGKAKERKLGGNPRVVDGILMFDGSTDGDRQVDPQIAVGGGYVLHATNSGLIIYDKEGKFVQGVSQNAFNGGIDPKLFFDPHNRVFGFDLWNPWDKEKLKPVNITISKTDNPTGAWNTYPVPAPNGVDGGGISYSRKWVGYSFPGGEEQSFVARIEDMKQGKPATIYHFGGNLGHPVAMQDAVDELYFFELTNRKWILRRIVDAGDGTPKVELVSEVEHKLKYVDFPPQSPQKGTEQKTASGDRNPKNLVIQGGFLWFSHAVNYEQRAAVQWYQWTLQGELVQQGLIQDKASSFIQTTIAVNKNLDVLVGYQETNENMFISPRFAWRQANDPKGTLRAAVSLGEGQGPTDGVSWGDYSGSVVDGDNGLDLWTIQSITDSSGKGDTVIARLRREEK